MMWRRLDNEVLKKFFFKGATQFSEQKTWRINSLCFFGRYATANSRYMSVELDDQFSVEHLSERFNGERSSKQRLESSRSALFVT